MTLNAQDGNMGDDLPAIEPVKIYENTYQQAPFEQEKCAAPAKARRVSKMCIYVSIPYSRA